MVEPTVCCVMLTRNRPEMAARAVAAFRAQTYERKRLLVYNTGAKDGNLAHLAVCMPTLEYWHVPTEARLTIGALRNEANSEADYDIIAHWDDDDWSHPNRLAEQVALLKSSGADCVGYNEALCWDTRRHIGGHSGCDVCGTTPCICKAKAWLYAEHATPGYALGGSFCYWRRAWEQHPFDALSQGEDERWRLKVKCVATTGLPLWVPWRIVDCPCGNRYPRSGAPCPKCHASPEHENEARLIIGVHGGNSSPYNMVGHPATFRRVPEWDGYCAWVMNYPNVRVEGVASEGVGL